MIHSRLLLQMLTGLLLPLFGGTVSALTLSVRDAKTGDPVANAVISVPASDAVQPLSEPAVMVQENRAFKPHQLVVPVGSAVSFPNHDKTQHHVYSFSAPHPFNIALYAGKPEAPITFDKPGIVELGCNIHDQMRAFIYVSGSSQTVTTGAAGVAQITPPADDAFEIRIWHERLPDNTKTQSIMIDGHSADTQIISLELTPEQTEADPLSDLQRRFNKL